MTVADVIGQTTDTGNVGRLSRAIMARMNVLVPGLMIPIASPRVVAAPRVHQVLQSAARAALMQVLAAHPDHPMALASCYRTLPQQVCLWAWYLASSSGGTERARRERAWALKLCTKEHAEKAEVPLAAPPGASSHEDAAAVDCQNSAFWRSAFLSPIFNLVCGVAYFQQGSLFKAIDFLKAAQNEASAFEPSIRSTLTYTFLQVKRLLGLINEADFKKGTSELMQQEGLGSFLELQKAFAKFLESKEKDEIRIKKLQNKILSLISKEPDNINLRIRAYSIILSIEQKQLLHNLALNFVMLCGRVPNLLATNTYKKWKELEDRHGKRLGLLLKYSLDTKQLLGFSNIAMEISDWSFQKLYTLFILKNWNANTLTVKSTPSLEELVILDREMERIDSIINGYEMLEHKENLVQALILKYEVLVFAGRKDEAPAVASQIASLIEKHDMNALKLDYQAMLNGCSRFKKFLTSFTNHMHNIYTVAKNSGIGKYFKQQIPPEYLESTEFLEKAEKWMVVDFFEMEFPLLNKHSEYETEC